MRTTTMTIAEFLNFRKEALEHKIEFMCNIVSVNLYNVESDADFLDYLGF